MTVLTIDEIKDKVTLVAKKYDIPRVYLFGSYARNTFTDTSDVDLVIDGSNISDYDVLFDLEEELEEALGRHVDIIEYEVLLNNNTDKRKAFNVSVMNEMIGVVWTKTYAISLIWLILEVGL